MRVLTGEHDPSPEAEGRRSSNVRRVPVGRKLTSIEVLERVFCMPFATALLFRPLSPPACGGDEEERGEPGQE